MLATADAPVGHALYAAAARGGAQAQGRRAGAIAPGCRADLVVLDTDDPALAEQRCRHGARRRDIRPVPRAGARRDGRRDDGSCATAIIATKKPCFARYRACLAARRSWRIDVRRSASPARIVATMAGDRPYGAIRDGAVGIAGDKIAWVGAERDLPPGTSAGRSLDARGAWVTPGLIDCHTHLVYAGSRVDEFEARLNGATYTEIAEAGGGIKATVRATRAATDEELVGASLPRLAALADEGATTVEIKSGYGLDTKNELRQLSAARRDRGGPRSRRADHAARGACAALGVFRTRRRLHRPRLRRDHSGSRCVGARGCRRRVLRHDWLHRGADAARVARLRARTGCR